MKIRAMIVVCIFGLLAGSVSGAVITFDKSLDVPDRDFTVTYEGNPFSFTIADVGNYKIGESVNINVNGGANNMRLVLFTVDNPPLTPWWKTFYNTSGSVSTTIPANRFNSSCPDVCEDDNGVYIMGPGIYALAVQNRDVDPAQYILAKPVIVSDYTISVTPNSTQVSAGGAIKVTVNVSKNDGPVSVASNNVKVEFVQDSTSTHFGGYATAAATTGTYEANIQVPSTASGSYKLYSAITTNRNIYNDYPEIIGAAGYSGTIAISTSTSTPTSTPTPTPTPTSVPSSPGEEFKNIELNETYKNIISKDVPVSYVFGQAGNPVSEVLITSNITAGDIAVKIEVLRGTSSLVSSPPPETVYKNINIWVGTSGFAVPKNIKNALIKFRVDNSWITTNAISSKDVKMFRWDGSQWIQLETTEKENSAEYTLYEAKTNSFSPFAISAKVSEITPGHTPQVTQPGTTATATETSVPPAPSKGTNILIVTALLCIVIIAVVVYILKKKNE